MEELRVQLKLPHAKPILMRQLRQIPVKEREDCELFYLSYIAQVGYQTEEAVIIAHPRYQELRKSTLSFRFLVLIFHPRMKPSPGTSFRIRPDRGLRRAASRQSGQPHHKCVDPGRADAIPLT